MTRGFLCAVFISCVTTPAFAVNTPISSVRYTVSAVPLVPGVLSMTPEAMNSSGQVVGQTFGSGGYGTFFYDGTTTSTYQTATYGGNAVGINDSSTIVGWVSPGGVPLVYTQHGAAVTQLAPWNASGTYPYAINNTGQITGYGVDPATQNARALLYTGGVIKNLGTAGGQTGSYGFALNSFGDVAGVASGVGPDRPMIYTAGAMHLIGSVGAQAYGINDSRQVVGKISSGQGMGFFYDYPSNKFTTVAPPLGFDGCLLSGINNAGTAVGQCSTQSVIDAAVYFPGQTMTDLNQLIDPTSGWHLYSAVAI
ncbi:MAG: hypothetical protein JWO87_297, partial [Phycisphaerales bacterium]|nr:hypothetical protein [Phycisphaerales bacterium]